MNRASIVLAALVLVMPAFAQTSPTSAQATRSDTSNPTKLNAETESTRVGVKALRSRCRDEAKSNGLKGSAKREAVAACVVRQRPDLAGREQCRTEGFGKGLRKEELHAFIRDCAKTKG